MNDGLHYCLRDVVVNFTCIDSFIATDLEIEREMAVSNECMRDCRHWTHRLNAGLFRRSILRLEARLRDTCIMDQLLVHSGANRASE